METLTFKMDLKKEPDEDGVIEGYAAVFGIVDNGMDMIEPGAFKGSLGKRKVKMLWQHDPSQPIGVWDEMAEDDHGLKVKGRILKDVRRGAEAIALYRAGAIEGLSIGYKTITADRAGEDGAVRVLKEVDLWEISTVTFPMQEPAGARIKGVRTIRDFEAALRDAGLSRNEAKAVAAKGFDGLRACRDGGERADDAGVSDFLRSINATKEAMK